MFFNHQYLGDISEYDDMEIVWNHSEAYLLSISDISNAYAKQMEVVDS